MNRSEILEKLAAREISVEEAERLLREAAAETQPQPDAKAQPADQTTAEPAAEDKRKNSAKPRWLKIRVSEGERVRVNISIPFGLIDWGLRMSERVGWGHGWRHLPREWAEFWDMIRHGEMDTLVEVEDNDSGERVRVFVE